MHTYISISISVICCSSWYATVVQDILFLARPHALYTVCTITYQFYLIVYFQV